MGRDLKLSNGPDRGLPQLRHEAVERARFAEMNDCKPVPGFDSASVYGKRSTAGSWARPPAARNGA